MKEKEVIKNANEIITEESASKTSKKGLKIVIIAICIIALIATALGVIYFVLQNKDNEKINALKEELKAELTLENKTVEYGSKLKAEELNLGDTKLYLDENEVAEYNFNEIGNVNFIQKATMDFTTFLGNTETITESKNITYTVEDTKAPIIEGIEDKTITEGAEIDLKTGIKAYDEVDREIEFVVEGEVDTNKVGEYSITVKATDKNGLETIKTFTVKVNAKPVVKTMTSITANNNSSNNSSRRYSSAFINKYYTHCSDEQIDKAEAIVKSIATQAKASSSDKLEQVRKATMLVFNYGVKTEYDYSYSNPYYRSPYGVFIAGISTCAGITRAMGRVLETMGYSYTHANENKMQHQWNIFYIDGKLAFADASYGIAEYGDRNSLEIY